jgi:hypothetical protein
MGGPSVAYLRSPRIRSAGPRRAIAGHLASFILGAMACLAAVAAIG